MATKQTNRREEAREKARILREQQARRDRRNKGIMIAVVLLLVALVAAAIWAIVAQGSTSSTERLDSAALPANTQTSDGGIPVGEGLAAGTTNEGVPTVDVYLDYTCHYCHVFEETYNDYLNEAAGSGEITVVYHPVALLDRSDDYSDYSGRAAAAAAAVAAEEPESFIPAHEALMAMGAEFTDAQGQGDFGPEVVAQRLSEAGVSDEVAQAAATADYTEWLEATAQQFARDGHRGTPTILVNGEVQEGWNEPEALQTWVEEAR